MQTHAELQAFVKKHQETILKVIHLLAELDTSPLNAEIILVHIAGMSAGIQERSILSGPIPQMLAFSWTFAAEFSGEE